jgi:biopolymer transport protein ExbD
VSASNNDDQFMSDINVTPLVDVMMVLLIVLMVAASYAVSKGLDVQLPEASTGAQQQVALNLQIDEAGRWHVNGQASGPQHLTQHVRQLLVSGKEPSAMIAAAAEVQHRHVVKALDLLRQLGVHQISIAVMPEGAG